MGFVCGDDRQASRLVELLIARHDVYDGFENDALGALCEVFFAGQDAYSRYAHLPEFSRSAPGARPWDGVGFKHPRGSRTGFWQWDLSGLKSAIHVDGTLNTSY